MAEHKGGSFSTYARKVLSQFRRDCIHWGREQVIGILVSCLIFLFQWHYGLISKSSFNQNLKILAYPYLIIISTIILWLAVRASWKIDCAQQIQVENAENAHRLEINFMSEKIDQLKQELQSEKKKQAQPNIVPEIVEAHVGMNWGTTPWKFDCAIAVKLYLVNTSSPVTIKGYSLTIKSPTSGNHSSDQRVVDFSYWCLCKEERVSQNGTRYIDRPLEPHLDSSIRSASSLERGQGKEGWLLFLVEGADATDCRTASKSVTVVDAFGGKHVSDYAQFSQPSALIERPA
jgi:hypothetical protein